jgi:chromosome partitioning protein
VSGLLAVNAVVAAPHLRLPIKSSRFAVEGARDLLETIEGAAADPAPWILGVAIAMRGEGAARASSLANVVAVRMGLAEQESRLVGNSTRTSS